MRFDDVIRTKDGFERRQWLRFALPKMETLTLEARGQRYRCHVLDISLGGARVLFEGAAPPPADVKISHREAGTFDGRCMWLDGEEMGLEFDQTEPSLLLTSQCLKQAVPEPRKASVS